MIWLLNRIKNYLIFSISILAVLLLSSVPQDIVSASSTLVQQNPENGHYYDAISVPEGILWPDAKTAAEAMSFEECNGPVHLATITSQEENDFIVLTFPEAAPGPTPGYWLGGFQPPGSPEPGGGWTWITGEPFIFTNWNGGEPNNDLDGENVIHFWGEGGKWNDLNDVASPTTVFGYVVECEEQPTAITLASFAVEANDGQATIIWETAAEIDNAGFNLYRGLSADGPWVQVNSVLIPAEGDPGAGASYTFIDMPGRGTFYYRLEDIDFFGLSTLHQPALVEMGAPLRIPWFRPSLPPF